MIIGGRTGRFPHLVELRTKLRLNYYLPATEVRLARFRAAPDEQEHLNRELSRQLRSFIMAYE